MFGDGVFGPAGVVWCCAAVVAVPALYMFVFMLGRYIPGIRSLGITFLTIALTYLGVGYLFGDALGIIAACLAFLTTGSVTVVGPQKVKKRVQTWTPSRRFFTSEDDIIIDGELK